MIARSRRALTLIELLIVVAIISLLASGMIAYITVPPREQVQATTDMENEMGLSVFFSKLVADAHNATGLTVAQNKRSLVFQDSGKDGSAVYFIDRKSRLRRRLMTRTQTADMLKRTDDLDSTISSSLMAENVRRFEATPLDGGEMWRISVSIATKDPAHLTLDRSIKLLVRNPSIHSANRRTSDSGAMNPRRPAEHQR